MSRVFVAQFSSQTYLVAPCLSRKSGELLGQLQDFVKQQFGGPLAPWLRHLASELASRACGCRRVPPGHSPQSQTSQTTKPQHQSNRKAPRLDSSHRNGLLPPSSVPSVSTPSSGLPTGPQSPRSPPSAQCLVPEGEHQTREGLTRLWQVRGFKASEESGSCGTLRLVRACGAPGCGGVRGWLRRSAQLLFSNHFWPQVPWVLLQSSKIPPKDSERPLHRCLHRSGGGAISPGLFGLRWPRHGILQEFVRHASGSAVERHTVGLLAGLFVCCRGVECRSGRGVECYTQFVALCRRHLTPKTHFLKLQA